MSERRPLIAGNWKMFKTGGEAVETAAKLADLVGVDPDSDVMIAPAFTALAPVSEILKQSRISVGAQDLYWEHEGAFTGEISAGMLLSAGCRYVIIGHSERRQFFNETDLTVNRKVKAALGAGLIPILCIGETEQERETDQTFSVLNRQVKKGLEGLTADRLTPLVIAYEPVWAIGTGKTATTGQAQEVHLFVREIIEKSFGNDLAKSMRILYGGSVKPGNIVDLMVMPDIDGALVGGASLEAETFSEIIYFNV
jgi:triosephosphate isomerase